MRSTPFFSVHHAFEEAGMRILVVAGKPGLGLVERQLRQQRHAVERLLAVGDDVVAERLDLEPREGVVGAFDFLQADDIGLTSPSARPARARAVAGSN